MDPDDLAEPDPGGQQQPGHAQRTCGRTHSGRASEDSPKEVNFTRHHTQGPAREHTLRAAHRMRSALMVAIWSCPVEFSHAFSRGEASGLSSPRIPVAA